MMASKTRTQRHDHQPREEVEVVQIYRPVAAFSISPNGDQDPIVYGLRVISEVLEAQLGSMAASNGRDSWDPNVAVTEEEANERFRESRPTIHSDHFRFEIGDTPVEVRIGDAVR